MDLLLTDHQLVVPTEVWTADEQGVRGDVGVGLAVRVQDDLLQ